MFEMRPISLLERQARNHQIVEHGRNSAATEAREKNTTGNRFEPGREPQQARLVILIAAKNAIHGCAARSGRR